MRSLAAIACGGLTAAFLDIVYAVLAWGLKGTPPQRVLQSVASGLLGRSAYQGGMDTALLGLGLHTAIALVMACVFVLAASVLPVLVRRPLAAGVLYGLGLFVVMNYVVMPLSALHRVGAPEGWLLAGALLAHTILVGIPIALFARAFLGPR